MDITRLFYVNIPLVGIRQIRSLGREDPLEEEMGIHSSILDWEIPWTEEPGGLQSLGSQKSLLQQVLNMCFIEEQII